MALELSQITVHLLGTNSVHEPCGGDAGDTVVTSRAPGPILMGLIDETEVVNRPIIAQ